MSSQDPFRQSIDGFDGSYPPWWNPEEHGNTLIGQLIRYEKGTTQYGPCHIAVIMDEDTGTVYSVWLQSFVLENRFREENPKPGERVGIKYLGRQSPKDGGAEYHNYHVQVDRRDQATPWERPAPAPAAPGPVAERRAIAQGQHPLPDDAPERNDRENMKGDFDRWLRKYRVESWQKEAFIEAHPTLPDNEETWDSGDYRVALGVLKKKGSPVFNAAARYLSQEFPCNPADVERVKAQMDEADVAQKDRLRIMEALDTGWANAVMWAENEVELLASGKNGTDEGQPEEEPATTPDLSQPDDDLPF